MRILDRYLMKEMLLTWLAVTIVLLVIMVGNVLARSLSRFSDGGASVELVLTLVAVTTISLLVTLIPLGLYLGIMLAHGRFYRDNEMAVMHACGYGWFDLMRPTAMVGACGALTIALLTIYASPWSARYEQQLKQEISDTSALSLLTPGRFVEASDGSAVLFVREANEQRTRFSDVFMYRARGVDELPAVDTARLAFYQRDEQSEQEYLVLSDGQTTIGQPGDADFTITEFRTQGVLRPRDEPVEPRLRTKGKSLTQLWNSDELEDKAELQWRVSIPLAALLLALLAVPLSYTSPREGRFGKIAIAILIYIPYANFLVLARKWIASGAMPSWIGLWPVHALVVVLILFLLARRLGWHWLSGAANSVASSAGPESTGKLQSKAAR